MFRKTTAALAAVLVLGSASMALADDSGSFDGRQKPIIENGSADQALLVDVSWRRHHSFVSRRAALRGYYGRGASSGSWLNRASQSRDGGW